MGIFKNFDRNRWLYNGLISTFILLYAATAFVSFYHAITFFNIANAVWLSVLLSFVAEIGQASVLFGILLTDNKKKYLPWVIMFILTSLQVIGNVVSSFDWIVAHNDAGLDGFKRSILFAVQTDDPEMFRIIVAWISGALLPIIALSMTALVAQNIGLRAEEKKKSQSLTAPTISEPNESTETDVKIEDNQIVDAKDIIGEVSRVRPTEEDLAILEALLAHKKPITEIPKEEEPEEKVKEEVNRIKEIMNKVEKIQPTVVDSDSLKEEQQKEDEETPEHGAPFDEPITYIEPTTSSLPYEPMDEYQKEITSPPTSIEEEKFDESDFDLPDDEDEFDPIDLTDVKPDKIFPGIITENGLVEGIAPKSEEPPKIELEKKIEVTPEIKKEPENSAARERIERLRQIARDNLKKK